MSKNFIDMSFEEIFPEQKPLQNKGDHTVTDDLNSADHQIEYRQDQYDTSDRFASQPEYPPPPAAIPQNYGTGRLSPDTQNIPSVPPIPEFTDFNPDSYKYNNLNNGNAPTTLPKIRNIVKNSQTATTYNNTPPLDPIYTDSAKGLQLVVLGILGIFTLLFPPMGTIIAILGIYNTIKYNSLLKKNPNIKKSSLAKTGQVICIISLILNIILLLAAIFLYQSKSL